MIRYPVTLAALRREIEAEKAGWLADAARRTDAFEAAGKYDERSGTWSQIKGAYLRLQHEKCVFCERRLAGGRFGRVEHDVEHYRPKSEAKAWPSEAQRRERGLDYDFPVGAASATGYYLLAYEPLNYATACKTCNTALKSSAFPIAGARAAPSRVLRSYRAEKPYLPYPIGRGDTDPARLLTFRGVVPVPVARRGYAHRRAQVTIDFFELDTREELVRERAELLRALAVAWEAAVSGRTARARERAAALVAGTTQPHSPHSACATAFVALLRDAPDEAEAIAAEIDEYLVSES